VAGPSAAATGWATDVPALPPFVPVKSPDQTLTLIQSNVAKSLGPVLANTLLCGTYVSVKFTKSSTDQLVTHGLGNATNVAWIVCQSPAQAVGFSIGLSPNNGNPGANPNPAYQILLRSSAPNITVGLYFFNAS